MYLQCKDCSLHYEIYGSHNDHLLLLHGNGEDSSYFTHQIAYFRKSYRVITLDTRGHGQSDLGKTPLDFDLLAYDVKYLLDALAISHIHILGFSDGANTAMVFAMRYPNYVTSLILNGGNLDPNGMKWHIHIQVLLEYWYWHLRKYDAKQYAKLEIIGLMVHHPHIDTRALHSIAAPVLVIAGDHDMIKDRHSREIAASFPNARFVCMKGTHFIAMEEYERFNEEVEVFLQSIK